MEVKSQEIYQQKNIELDDALDSEQTYLCKATSFIELLPGFSYDPKPDNNMLLDVDRYSVFPPSDGMYGGNSDDEECVVGSIPASFNVGSTGAATYSIDIQLPQALCGMSPKLSLMYNSQSGNGLLGWAWNLLGISSIERVGQTEYHDGRITGVDFTNDRFSLDGQRLMSIGDNNYKTEVDNLDKIVSCSVTANGPGSFVVWKADGTIWEYGVTGDSKIEAQGSGSIVLKWMVSRITDRNGNTITYHYYENNNTGESYIKDIEYVSNENIGVLPAYRVVFQYDERSDVKEGYVHGRRVVNSKILKAIDVFNNYSGKKIMEYALQYDATGYYGKNYYIYNRLKSIQLTIDGKKVNPTRIVWNSEDKWATENSCGYKKYELDKEKFNKYTFVGDFNGDGASDVLLVPYKVQNTYSSDVYGEVYLNKGNGIFETNPLTKVKLGKNLEWIYIIDLNGDGVDDIVPYDVYYNDAGVVDCTRYRLLVMNGGVLMDKGSRVFLGSITLLPGNYIDKTNGGFLVLEAFDGNKNKNNAHYLVHQNGSYVYKEIENSNVINGKNINITAMDMSGDGMTDILALENDGYKVYKLRLEGGSLYLDNHCSGMNMTNKIYPFPNDYNGDGKTDLLYYDPNGFWNVAFSKGTNFMIPKSLISSNIFRNVILNSRDRYYCSLKETQKPTVTIRTADFDGDGTSDVGVFHSSGGNYYLELGLSMQKQSSGSYDFAHYGRYYMPINYSHQTIHIGRFLPHENVSILSSLPKSPSSAAKSYVVSFNPISAYYSVEKIVDGMGNSTELLYDYLFPENSIKDPFYYCYKSKHYDVETKSMPILALKEVKTYNINGKPVVKKYTYSNALVHKKGHGFLGFENVTVREYVNNTLVKKQILEYNVEPMESHCMPMLCYDRLYYGNSQLVNEKAYTYKKYVCDANAKVILPLLSTEWESVFDVDKKSVVIKNIYVTNTYQSDIASDKSYKQVVQLKKTRKGYDDVKSMNVDASQYVEEMQIVYDNDIAKWMINRPKKVIKSVRDKAGNIVGDVRLIEYCMDSPTKIAKEKRIPNASGNMNDSLMLVVSYKYDKIGNMIEQRISSPSLKANKIIRSEYGPKYQYRYKTKSIDELGRTTSCEYDDDFGILKSTMDFNNLKTIIDNEPFGIESTVIMPDGVINVKAIRWSDNNRYAPQNASYYLWEKSSGKAETMIFCHKSGAELRQVTFDLNGEAVFVDKIYDDLGNLKQESCPYYESDAKLYVSNVYDMYNRKVETSYPNGMNVAFVYDGNSVEMEYSVAGNTKKHRKETYNMRGWLIKAVDDGGKEIRYEYYSDGKIKTTQIGENKATRIEVTYDNRRNKASLYDPNYGLISYKNDALGNVKKVYDAQNVVVYDYDVLGRMVSKIENNLVNNIRNEINWEYGNSSGKNGVLTKITTSRNHQMQYEYDDKLRVVSTVETINGVNYRTSYSYDEANRISCLTYPSGYGVLKKYSNTGYEHIVCDAATNAVLWKTNKTNSEGCITEYQVGNGLKTKCSYNPRNSMVENIFTIKGDKIFQDLEYKYDESCNLISRCDFKNYNCEEFVYDVYDRLTNVILNGNVNEKMKYYDSGNIKEKEVEGVKVMYNTGYAGIKQNAIVRFNSDDERMFERFKQNIKYSTFDNVISVEEKDEDKYLSIDYGFDGDRIFMRYEVGSEVKEKTYVGDCEYVVENGKKKVFTYLDGPMGVFAVHVDDGKETVNYVHKDNLGSWNVITDKDGKLLEELNFDAWGNMRDPITWSKEHEDGTMLYDRGFTGHEHLVDFGLINMNGRLYDPLMSMMLSPDNNIQLPKTSLNFNRYSYCMNNPLKYTDPTGELVESVALGVAGGAMNVLFNARNIDSFGEAALLFGAGFVKGFLTEYTMGQSWFLQVGVGAVADGLMAGTNKMVSVGNGDFDFTGDDWNSVKSASFYGLGSGLVKSFMHSYWAEPTAEQYGESFFEICKYREYAHGITSLVAHGAGCWFSGQPFLSTMKFKDVGFDLKMLGIISKRLISSYIHTKTDFGEKVVEQRAKEIKEALLQDMLSENPETPDFNYEYSLSGVFFEDFRLYVVGNIFEILPSEYEIYVPKPYFEEVMTFPFSYSLFKTLFFKEE